MQAESTRKKTMNLKHNVVCLLKTTFERRVC